MQYREKLANEIPDKHLLTGIDLSTGFSISLVENIVSNIWRIDCLETLKNLFSFFNEEHALQSWFIKSSVKGRFTHVDSCLADSDDDSLSEHLISPLSSEHSKIIWQNKYQQPIK